MTGGEEGRIDRLAMKLALARWRRALAKLPQQSRSGMTVWRRTPSRPDLMTGPSHDLDWAAPLADAPLGTDWLWRPPCLSAPVGGLGGAVVHSPVALGVGTGLFHDCPLGEIALRQMRSPGGEGTAPWALHWEIQHFAGSFLSLAIDLPSEGLRGLHRRHLLRVEAELEVERPLGLLVRLNLRQGPNQERVQREMPLTGGRGMVEFDLFYAELNERRIQQAWIDLIFADPSQNRITLRDLRLSRRPRAEL